MQGFLEILFVNLDKEEEMWYHTIAKFVIESCVNIYV